MPSPSIVIAGAGLGGFQAFLTLKKLLKKYHLSSTITLINNTNYFTFVPMLHEVATGSVEPSHVAVPLREEFVGSPHVFVEARVKNIDLKKQIVCTDQKKIPYDYLIIALGSGVNFFKTSGAEKYARTVRTLPEALSLREQLLTLLESDKKTIDISVVGGGYTGVELSGQFGDFSRAEIRKLYPGKELRIRIIEANPSLVTNLPLQLQKLVAARLQKLGITIFINERVQAVNETTITLGSGEVLPSDLTVWSAGVGNRAAEFLGDMVMEKGCVMIDEYLRIKNVPHVYAVGDIAWGCNPGETKPFPQLGEVAYHQGTFAAHHLVAALRNRPTTTPFKFVSKGTLMPIGDWYGVAKIGSLVLHGRLIWWLRRTVYIWYMPTFLRKLRIIIDWTLHSFVFRHTINIVARQPATKD